MTLGLEGEEINKLIENLSALNNVLEKLKKLSESKVVEEVMEIAALFKALRDMLNEDSIQNIGRLTSTLIEIIDQLDSNRENVKEILKESNVIPYLLIKLKEMREAGVLDNLINISYALKSLRDLINDDAITNIGATLSQLLDFLPRAIYFLEMVNKPVFLGFIKALTSEEALNVISNSQKVGLGGLVKSLNDPEVQRGLGVFISLLKVVGRYYNLK
jgi:uncharacterized protein YjgD (DUF1641 family)